MMFVKSLMIAGLTVSLLAPGSQDGEETKVQWRPPPDFVFKTIDLDHINANEVGTALHTLGMRAPGMYALGERRMLLSGREDHLKYLISEIIPIIDVPDERAEPNVTPAFIPLKSISSATLTPALKAVISDPATNFAIDSVNNLLVVHGTPADIEAVRALIETLRVQRVIRPEAVPNSFTIQFYFLRCTTLPQEREGAPRVPPHLSGVAKALTEAGFQNIELASAQMIGVQEGRKFGLNPEIRWPSMEPNVACKINGALSALPGGESVELEIAAGLQAPLEPRHRTNLFGVHTSIIAKIDSFVIVGATPTTTAEGDAIALVVRVTAE